MSNLTEEVLVVGADRTVLYANQPVVERLGPSLDRIVGRPCHHVFERDSSCCQAPESECAVKRVLESGQAAPFVCRQSGSPRHQYYFNVEAFPLRDEQGRLTAVMCLPRESVRLERYRRILDAIREGVVVASRSGRIIEVNSALSQMLGFSQEELAGRNVTDFFAPEAALALRNTSEDSSPSTELNVSRKDGSTLAAEVAVSPLFPELKGIYIIFVRDITARKERDESISEQADAVIKSAAEYRAIFEASNDALMVIEDDTTVSMVNRRFEEFMGYRWHEVEGKMSLLSLVSEQDRDHALAVHRMRREESQTAPSRHTMWMITKTGPRWLAEVSGALIPATRRSVVALRDVTAAQALQQKLERHKRELEVLYGITALLSRSTDLSSMLELALDKVAEITEGSRGVIYLLDEERQELLVRACTGQGKQRIQVNDRLALGDGFESSVARTGKPLFAGEFALNKDVGQYAVLQDGLRALACVPLVSSGNVLGVMSISTSEPWELSAEEQRLLISTGNEIGMAVERALRLERVRDKAREVSTLMLVSQEIASSLDLQRVLDRTLSIICMQVWADQGGICLLDETSGDLVAKSLWGDETIPPGTIWKPGQGIAGWAAINQTPILCDDAATDPRLDRSLAPDLGYHSMIAVPLRAAHKFLGVVVVAGRRIGAFTPSHLRLISGYAAQASLAVEKALLYQRVSEEASSLAEALRKLAASEHRFRELIEHSSDSILVLTAGGEITYASPSNTRISGHAMADMVGVEAFQFIDPEDRDKALALFDEVTEETGRTGTSELRARNRDGQSAWIEATLTNLLEEPGVQGVVVNWRDISERKRMETERERLITELKRVAGAMQAAAEEWRTTFDGITEGIFLLDSERKILRCNSAMRTILGLPFDRILGRGCCELICRGLEGESDCTALRALQTQCKESSILQIAGRWFAVTVYPLQNSENLPGRTVYIMSDITEQKKGEESLRESEKRIRMLAEASARAQEEERRSVADEVHDRIAQTLVAVHQQLQVLRSASQNDVSIQRVVNRTLELQQRAIDETRNIMKDLYSPTLEKYGLVTVIEEELHQLREDTGLKTRIHADCVSRPPKHVEGVLYRVFHEALTNVRKHARGAELVAVTVKWEHDNVSIVVQDDGPGFDVEAMTKRKSFGGLVSMRRRAEIIGGTFEVKSDPGQGARVSASVPARQAIVPSLGEDVAT